MKEHNEPYLVYTSNRPHRIAFLVDIKKRNCLSDIERIISYSQGKWGGKFFQIIPLRNGVIESTWLNYLTQYDPDIIGTLASLNPTTLKRIALKTNPYVFQQIDMRRGGVYFTDDPLDVLPSEQNTANIWRNPIQSPPKLFEMDLVGSKRKAPIHIANFVKFNFGQLDRMYYSTKLLEKYDVKKIKVYDKRSFLKGMEVLDEWTRYIYPSDYSRLPGIHYEHKRDYEDKAVLFVGDEPLDIIHYWNRALLSPDWLSQKMIYAWVPTKMLDDTDVTESVKKWLSKFTDFGNGNSGHKQLILASKSLSTKKLQEYQQSLSDGTYIAITINKINQPTVPDYSKRISISSDMASYSVSGDTFNINLQSTDQLQGTMGSQKWMTDVYIQQKDDDKNVRPAKEFWLQLPQNNNLAHLVFPKTPARINRLGISSLPVTRKPEDLLLSITIPEESGILGNLLVLEPNRIYYTADIRDKVLKAPFDDYLRSEAGRHLRGFLHLFDGMMEAVHFFENPYWRRTIMSLSGEDVTLESPRNTALRNRIRKELNKVQKPISENRVDSWMKTTQNYARQLKLQAVYKDFPYFKNELQDEFETYRNEGNTGTYNARAEARMRNGLSWLLSRNVIMSGFLHKCYHCGLQTWYSVGDVNALNECPGCGYQFYLEAEQEWYYKLNSISSTNGAIYSQIPIVMALGALRTRSTHSFFYAPPVEVYPKRSGRPLTDLDLVAIVDGKLIIGEVKNSQSLLKDDDFEKLYKAATRIRPSMVYISCPDEKPTATTQKKIEGLRAKLEKHEIGVEWLDLNGLFGFFSTDPEYVF